MFNKQHSLYAINLEMSKRRSCHHLYHPVKSFHMYFSKLYKIIHVYFYILKYVNIILISGITNMDKENNN